MFADIVNEMAAAIQSSPIVYVPHHDYNLVDSVLREALGGVLRRPSPGNRIIEFDQGIGTVGFERKTSTTLFEDLGAFLNEIVFGRTLDEKGYEVFLIKNAQAEIASDTGIQARLLLFAQRYEREAPLAGSDPFNPLRTVVLVDPSGKGLPAGLSRHVVAVEIPPPEEEEIESLIRGVDPELDGEGTRELVRTLKGLDRSDILHILSSITVWTGGVITRESFSAALLQKKQIARSSGVVEVVEADESFADVGGLEGLRESLRRKAVIFRDLGSAEDYGIPVPKGVLIIGMPGCGKTMMAKAIAHEFKAPLLRLDMNRILGSYVGDSERNMRRAFDAAETASPCVLWIDEIEKAFSGTGDAGGKNNDTVMRMMGMFLTWLQELSKPVFIVATANDEMRPEFMRKGRFDDVFFVDWPRGKELEAILRKQIEGFSRKTRFDFSRLFRQEGAGNDLQEGPRVVLEEIVHAAEGFTGAEINSALKLVLERVFVSARESHPESQELLEAERVVTPEMLVAALKDMQPYRLSLQERKEGEESAIRRVARLRGKYTSASEP